MREMMFGFRFFEVLLGVAATIGLLAAASGAGGAGRPVPGHVDDEQTAVEPVADDTRQEAGYGEEVLRVPIGSGPAEIGVIRPEEANPEGPMAFDISPSGEVYILDQLNSRVQVFAADGSHLRSLPGVDVFYRDLDLGPGDDVVLLEPDREGVVVIWDASGTELQRIALPGVGITEAGEVLYVHAREDGVWADAGDHWVELGEARGAPADQRPIVFGDLSPTGRDTYRVKVLGDITLWIKRHHLVPGDHSSSDISLYFDEKIRFAFLFGFDEQGRLYLHVELEAGESTEDQGMVLILDEDGVEIGRLNLPIIDRVEEVNRDIRVTPDGAVYLMQILDDWVVVRRLQL